MYKEFFGVESYSGSQDFEYFKPYSQPVYLFWQSTRLTFLQMFPMKGITILNFDHSHSFMDICYVFSGSGYLKFEDGETIRLRRGTICYINSTVVHRIISDANAPLEIYNASFEIAPCHSADKVPESIAEAEEKLLKHLSESPYLSANDCFHCEDFLRNALLLLNSLAPGDFVKFKNCISNFLMSAFQAITKLELEPTRSSPDHFETDMTMAAMQMVFYMRDHYTEGISLADVAQALSYSPRQCQRLIHDFLGVGFTEFILAHQLSLAKQLLTMTNATLEEISERTGFKSSKALTQQFKAIVGVTPNMYRKNAKRSSSADKYAGFEDS